MANKALPFALLTIAAAGVAAAVGVTLARKNSDNKIVAKITDYLAGIKKEKEIAADEEVCTCCCEDAPAEEACTCSCEDAPAEGVCTCSCEDAPAEDLEPLNEENAN